MTRRDGFDLLLLGALWGASFLFMRLGAPEFGPLALVFLRVAGASMLLVPLMLQQKQAPALVRHWRAIALVGISNSALPFVLLSTAALVLGAGLMSVFNATTPIWTALLAWAWLADKPRPLQALGLAVGLLGVLGLAWGRADFKPGDHGISPALGIAACLAATGLYALASGITRKHLAGVPTLAVAAGSQLAATAVLLVPALLHWPAERPGPMAWASVAALATGSTAVAYVLYFRLIAHAGAANASAVTFLIPAFAIAWGGLFLGEHITPAMLLACAVILGGTALSTGLLRRRAG